MPQAIPVIVGAVKAITWKAVGKFIVKAAISTAISYGIGKLVAKKPQGLNGSSLGSRLDETRDILQAHRLIYGRDRVGPCVRFRHKAGTNGKYLYLGLVWAGHECDGFEQLRFGQDVLTFDGAGLCNSGPYAGKVRCTHHLGAWNQTADANFLAELPGVYRSTDRAQGRCWSALRVEWDEKVFPAGLPAITAVIRGRKIYDPRNGAHNVSDPSTWTWSANPALQEADYLRGVPMFDHTGSNIVRRFGLGLPDERVINAQLTASANACDEDIPLAAGGTEKRYEGHGSYYCDSDHQSVLASFESAMAGRSAFIAGEAYIRAGYWEAPDVDITENMLRRGQRRTRNPLSRREKFNFVTGSYTNPAADYQRTSFPVVKSATFITQDRGHLQRVMDLPMTASKTMAERIVRIAMLRSRQGVFYQAPYRLAAIQAVTGQNVRISRTLLGWTHKHFELLQLDFSMISGSRGGVGFGVDLTSQETDASIFDWNTSLEQTVDPAPNTSLWNPRSVPVPAGYAATVATAGERTAQPRIKLTNTAPADQFILSGGWTEHQYKKAADADWIDWSRVPGSQTIEYVTDLQVGTSTQFRARHVHRNGTPGEYCTPVSATPAAGEGSYQLTLTNFRHLVRANAEGVVTAGELGSGGRAVTKVKAWAGNVPLTAVGSMPGPGQFSVIATLIEGTSTNTKEDAETFRLDTLDTDRTVIRITFSLEGLISRTEDWILWKSTDGGAYQLFASAYAVNRSLAGAHNPTAIRFFSKAILSIAGLADYAGRFKIATFADPTWTDVYTSAGNETFKDYTVPGGSYTKLRCQLYKAGSFSTFLDEIEVPITNDGLPGDDGDDGDDGAPGAPGADGDDGVDGLDGAYVSFVFKNASSAPSAPTGGSYDGTTETIPSGWTDDPTTPGAGELTYVSKGRYYDTGSGWTNAGWGTPAKWFQKGDTGATGATGATGSPGATGPQGPSGATVLGYTLGEIDTFSTGSYVASGGLSVPITSPDANARIITLTGNIEPDNTGRSLFLRLLRNGSPVGTVFQDYVPGGAGNISARTVVFSDTPGAGSVTYAIEGKRGAAGNVATQFDMFVQ